MRRMALVALRSRLLFRFGEGGSRVPRRGDRAELGTTCRAGTSYDQEADEADDAASEQWIRDAAQSMVRSRPRHDRPSSMVAPSRRREFRHGMDEVGEGDEAIAEDEQLSVQTRGRGRSAAGKEELSVRDFFTRHGIPFSLSAHSLGRFWTDCSGCGGERTLAVNGQNAICVCCGREESWIEYQSNELQRTEERTTGGATRVEQVESQKSVCRRVERQPPQARAARSGAKEHEDMDLFDRVSWLNLEERESNEARRHRDDWRGRLRRLIEESNGAGSPRNDSALDEAFGTNNMTTLTDPHIKRLWVDSTSPRDLSMRERELFSGVMEQLGADRISDRTLAAYNVRLHLDSYDQPALLYPRYKGPTTRTRIPSGLKIIRRTGDRLEKENLPDSFDQNRQRFSGIFGYHMASPKDSTVVLTTNERDALAIYEHANGLLALALPRGENIDEAVVPFLEDFDSIYLWFPFGHLRFAKDYAYLLNSSRCYIVQHLDRPIELVRRGKTADILTAINGATRVRVSGFRSMFDIRGDLRDEIVNSYERFRGLAQWKRFSLLNKYLGGFRPGELTVLTGGTGYGKTTFLCEYSLDLLLQGVRTLFCSFEMSDEKVLKWILVQFAGIPLHRDEYHSKIESWLDKFQRVRGDLVMMNSNAIRNQTVKEIADLIRTHAETSGIQHVVIDNLQFLIGQAHMSSDSALERYNQQDRFVGYMRALATELGCHVTMVVHPRKADIDKDLDIMHFGGSPRVTQEADNVLVIQRRRLPPPERNAKKYLHILKNRHGGRTVHTNTIEMVFDDETYTHQLVETE